MAWSFQNAQIVRESNGYKVRITYENDANGTVQSRGLVIEDASMTSQTPAADPEEAFTLIHTTVKSALP